VIRNLYPALDRVLRPFGLYAAYALNKAEFVTFRKETPASAVSRVLTANGYERLGLLSAAKRKPATNIYDSGSYRRVDPENPRRQYHVHLFDGLLGTAVYSHYEYRPDLRPVAGESLREMVGRLREHYRPSWGSEWGDGTTYVMGKRCDVVDSLRSKL